uniref:glutaminase n=1 Tax=Timema genevievae TaxID=629358 RepID=A0A7R9JWS6_TIMGE|nr:unnamed protein product [Timema genevievae]
MFCLLHSRLILLALEDSGLRKTDPRLAQVMKLLDDFSRAPQRENGGATSQLSVRLNPEVFKEIISPNVRLISQAFTNQLIVPDFTEFCDQIKMFYDKCKTNQDGKVNSAGLIITHRITSGAPLHPQTSTTAELLSRPNYIPDFILFPSHKELLSRPNYIPDFILFHHTRSYSPDSTTSLILSCSITQVSRVAQTDVESKPLTYAIALEELGNEKVHSYVGQEPSGRMFNELVLDSQTSQLEKLLRMILFGLVVISSNDLLLTNERI